MKNLNVPFKGSAVFKALCLPLALVLAVSAQFTVHSQTILVGDHWIQADSPDLGDLTVDGQVHVGGDIDFGTTVETVPQAGMILSYGESGANYNVDSIATRDGVAFSWQQNGGGTASTKMTLSASNALSLYAPSYNPASPNTGIISLTPSLSGSGITIDGASVITSATYAGTGGILSLNSADARYVLSTDITVGSATVGGIPTDITGPTVALPGGSATGPSSFAGINATASGLRSIAVGYSSTASGPRSLAIGAHSNAESGGTAVGIYSSASGGSTAIGPFSTASSQDSIAIGSHSIASGSRSIAIGHYSVSSGIDSTASGFGAEATGDGSIASGISSTASGTASVASGPDSYASETGAIASGSMSIASGWYSTSAGVYTNSVGREQFVIGVANLEQGNPYDSIPTDDLFIVGNGSIDWGDNIVVYRSNALTVKKNGVTSAFAVGYNPSNPNVGKIALNPDLSGSSITIDGANVLTAATANALFIPLTSVGDFLTESQADAQYVLNTNFSVGSATQSSETGPTIAMAGGSATGPYTFAGIGATASGLYSTATASYSLASGNYSTAVGYNSSASGEDSTAIGIYSTASGFASTSIGYDSVASGNASLAIGPYSVASGSGSVASGYQSISSGTEATAAGANSTAAGHSQYVVGRYNVPQGNPTEWVATDDLFIVGNGTSTTPSNAFVVKKDGDTTVNGDATINGKMVVSGPIRIQPAGDLAMGLFISGPQQ